MHSWTHQHEAFFELNFSSRMRFDASPLGTPGTSNSSQHDIFFRLRESLIELMESGESVGVIIENNGAE